MRKISVLISIAILLIAFSSCSKSEKTEVASFKESDIKFQLETDHFLFYSTEGDKKCLDDLSSTVESNYERIVTDLKISLDYKPKVYIYPDIKSFHKATGQPDAPDWGVGTAWGKDLKMVSPLNPGSVHDYDSVKQVAVHEFVHVLQINMAKDPANLLWLWEGVATYEAKQMNDETRKRIKQLAQEGKAPTIDQLTKDFYSVTGSYYYAYTIAEFIVNEYGNDKLVEVLKAPKDMEKILGISMSEFEKKWIEFIKK